MTGCLNAQLARHATQALNETVVLDIQVPFRGGQRTVAEQFLDLPGRHPLIMQTAGTLMSQIMPIQIGILGDDPMMVGTRPPGRDRVPIFAGVNARSQEHFLPIRAELRHADRAAVQLAEDVARKARTSPMYPGCAHRVPISAGRKYTPMDAIRVKGPILLGKSGGRGRNRTADTTIFSRTVALSKSACFRRFALACTHGVPAAAVVTP